MTKAAWYLLYTKPRQEAVAMEHLSNQNYHAYLPQITVEKRKKGQYQAVVEPMFPRYIFIQLDQHTDNWGPIRSTRGVAGMVRFGGEPAKVPDDLIACLQQAQAQTHVEDLAPTFVTGDVVKVMAGPFAGYEAVFSAEKSDERVIILLNIANAHSKVQLSKDDIEKV